MKHSDAIRFLVQSQMDEAKARAVVEVLEDLLADELGTHEEALAELRADQEKSRIEMQNLSVSYERLRAEVATSVAVLRTETMRSTSLIEVSMSKLQTELSTKVHDQIRNVILIVVGILSLACAASAGITAYLAQH
jgi:predicted  nucleic acid-binding Zn-ribbon protein